MKALIRSLAVTFPLMCSPVLAEENAAENLLSLFEQNSSSAKSFKVDLNTPTSPGFAVIGASPKKVSEPGSLQELVLDNAGFLENGSLKPGLAINFQPFWLFGGDNITLEQYSGYSLDGSPVPNAFTRAQRIMARMQLSFASVQGQNATTSKGARFGFGVHTQLLDGSDPRNIASARCTINAWDQYAQANSDEVLLSMITRYNAERDKYPEAQHEALQRKIADEEFSKLDTSNYDKAYKVCLTEAEQRTIRARSWMVGAGVAASSASGKIDSLNYSGASFWTTYKHPFGNNSAFILFGQTDLESEFQNASGTLVTGNAYHAAVSLAHEELTWKLDATASYHFYDSSSFSDDYMQFAVNGATKLSDGVWLEGSFGTRTGSSTQDDSFALVQLKFDLSKAADGF